MSGIFSVSTFLFLILSLIFIASHLLHPHPTPTLLRRILSRDRNVRQNVTNDTTKRLQRRKEKKKKKKKEKEIKKKKQHELASDSC